MLFHLRLWIKRGKTENGNEKNGRSRVFLPKKLYLRGNLIPEAVLWLRFRLSIANDV